MNTEASPLVSVLTPLYNAAPYLRECIESVLDQTYSNWECILVNNCSTDGSADIAQQYAASDSRIRVVNNEYFLRIVENHNKAICEMSPDSKYCKFVFADDWLYPTCIEEMVRLAEHNRSVGLVGAYTMDGRAVLWHGPPYPSHRVSGRQVCQDFLLGGQYIFGPMTSLLVRCDLIRKRAPFFDPRTLHADTAACLDLLQESDYGYIHQVLSYNRPPVHSTGTFAEFYDSVLLGNVVVFLKYGPIFLTQAEYQRRWKQIRWKYHRVLANNVLRLRSKRFWSYHTETLAAFGGRIEPTALLSNLVIEVGSRLLHPFDSSSKASRWWVRALDRLTSPSDRAESLP